MPYIEQNIREDIDKQHSQPHVCGSLNYQITKIIHDYILYKGLCYGAINEAVGALECAKLELYRMVAAPYEDKKIKENGSVSELDGD